MSAKRLSVAGHVQGVGFRDWAIQQALALGLSGWVRNRRDGSVELLLHGEVDAVEEMMRACRRGPRHADVIAIEEFDAEPPEHEGFLRMPTL